MVRQFEVRAKIAAPAERIWALLADVETWDSWGPFDEAGLERPGGTVPEGVGAVRRFRRGRWSTREEVVAFDPPRHLGYVLLSGIPIKGYRADVTLVPTGTDETEIVWRSSFRSKIPGTGSAVRRSLRAFIADLVRRLGEAARAGVAERSP